MTLVPARKVGSWLGRLRCLLFGHVTDDWPYPVPVRCDRCGDELPLVEVP